MGALTPVPELTEARDPTPPPSSPRSLDEDSGCSRHAAKSRLRPLDRALATSFCEAEDSRAAGNRISAALLEKLLRKLGRKGLRVPPLCGCAVPPADPAKHEQYVRRMACSTAHARNCDFFADPRKLQRRLYDLLE